MKHKKTRATRSVAEKITLIKSCNAASVVFIVIATFLMGATTYGQSSQPFSSSYEVQKIPANPDVATLGKFGDVPVNQYNGTANVTIPIYEIDLDGLKVPIALKYNTSGIRVEQEATWVGLGWSLSEGMTITREVNGYDDIYNYNDLSAESVGWIFSRDYMTANQEDNWANPGDLSEYDLVEIQRKGNGGSAPIDTEPDFYAVSLPSGSCKFTLPKMANSNDTILNAVISDSKNFRIQYHRNSYNFVVTDPNGFIYNFSVKEKSTGYGSYESQDNYSKTGVVAGIRFPIFHGRHLISSWKVSKVTSPRGRELFFTYEDGFYFSFPHFTEIHEVLSANYPNYLTEWNQQVAVSPQPRMSASMTAFNVKNLSLISGDFGSVDFVLSDRSDLVSKQDKLALSAYNPVTEPWNTFLLYPDALVARKLGQVIIRNKDAEVTKSATLTYSYFNSQKVGVEPVYNSPDPFECDVSYIRLKLDRVDIGDQRYSFEYHQPNALPRKDSRAVDFWGFYNGVNNNTKIPSFNRFYVNHPGMANGMNDEWHEFFIKVSGGNRGADINYGKIGALEKITYPTGGYSVFEYEGHKVTLAGPSYSPTQYRSGSTGQLRFTSLTSSPSYNYKYQYLKLAKTPTYSLNHYNTCQINYSWVQPNTNFQVNQTSFCNTQTFNVTVQATISCSVGCGQGNPTGRAVWVRNVNSGQEYNFFYHNSQTYRQLSATMNLPVGTYELKTANWTQGSPLVVVTTSATLGVSYSLNITPPAAEEFEVGGTRVKSVTNYDVNGGFISKSRYLYDQFITENGQQVSNGKLMDDLVFHSKAQNLFDYCAIDFLQNTEGHGAQLSSEIKLRTNPSAGGSHIGYGLVREEKIDSQGNKLGQTVTEFLNKPNEYILKPSEQLPRILAGALTLEDFTTVIGDLAGLGFTYYTVNYGSVYNLGVSPVSYEYSNGSVLSQKTYNQANTLVRETSNTYNTANVISYSGEVGAAVAYPVPYVLGNYLIKFQPWRKILRADYRFNLMHQLVATTTNEYSGGSQLSSTSNNYYDNNNHLLTTRTSITGSDGALYTTRFYYPKDLTSTPFMNHLVTKNEVNTPIIIERYKGDISNPYTTLLEKVQTLYNNSNSITADVLPSEVFTYKLGNPTGHQRVVYEKYSNFGTLTQYRKSTQNHPTSLLWGHYKTVPVAQVVNAADNQIAFTSFDEPSLTDCGWTSVTTLTTAAAKTGTKSMNAGGTLTRSSLPVGNYVVGFWARAVSGSGSASVNGFSIPISDTNWRYYETTKSGISSVTLTSSNAYIDEARLFPVGALMTSYTYKPLVGMTSQTDPNGRVTYFEYDSNGRLQTVRDSDGNIVKSYSYGFKQTGAN